MSALPPHVPRSIYAKGDTRERTQLGFVQSDIQNLHAHMAACHTRRSWIGTLACWTEVTRAFLLQRMVSSVTCAVVLGLTLGGICRLLFAAS